MDATQLNPELRALREIFLALFPELAGYHAPIRAKVTAVHESGGRMDETGHRYSVDVQPLQTDGSEDERAPVVPDVELPVWWAGPDRGIYCLPKVGAIVRLQWYYNDPSYPFVAAVLGDGFSCPDHPIDSFIVQHSDGVKLEIRADGSAMDLLAPAVNLAGSDHPVAFADVVKSFFDAHVHPANGTPPLVKMTGHDSGKVFVG